MIQFHNPEAETAVEDELYTLSHDISENEGENITVALLANGFPDSENFVKKVGEALVRKLPKLSTKFWNKGNAGVPASKELLEEIKATCQVAIAAYGH